MKTIENELKSNPLISKDIERPKEKSPVEYYAINLMDLNEKGLEINMHRKPTIMLM